MSSVTSSPHPQGHHHHHHHQQQQQQQEQQEHQHLSMDFDLDDFTTLSSTGLASNLDHYPNLVAAQESTPAQTQAGTNAAPSLTSTSSEASYPHHQHQPTRQQQQQQQQQQQHHHHQQHSRPSSTTMSNYSSPAAESLSRAQTSSSNHHSPAQQHNLQRSTSSRGGGVQQHQDHSLHSVFTPLAEHHGDTADMNVQLSQLLDVLSKSAGPSSRAETESVLQGGVARLSLQDIQRLLAEKERSDRLQNLQTALLKQQLEALQRAQQQQQQHSAHQHGQQQSSQNTPAAQPSLQQLLTVLGSGASNIAGGGGGNHSVAQMHQGGHQQVEAHHLLANLLGGNGQQIGNTEYSKMLADSATLLAQYGVLTPPASGALNMGEPRQQQPFMSPLHIPQGAGGHLGTNGSNGIMGVDVGPSRAWDGQIRNQYTPLESPAVTPASVFSTMSLGGIPSADHFFSPLTSPALHPTPPQPFYTGHSGTGSKKSHGGKSTTPTASPLALTGKPGPLPRKNRSTTAEARANRSRPSPLIKPTISNNGNKRKKERGPADDTASTDLPMTATPSTHTTQHRSAGDERNTTAQAENRQSAPRQAGTHTSQGSFSTFLPLSSGVSMSMVASPSEGAASTPSPIDLEHNNNGGMGPPAQPADQSKPLTPGSIMGIAGSVKGNSSQRRSSKTAGTVAGSDSNVATTKSASASSSTSSFTGANGNMSSGKAKARAAQSVSFAAEDGATGEDEEKEERDEDIDASATGGASSGAKRFNGSPSATSVEGPDSRRTSHKAAEQKRRDSLKYCFDELRCMLPPITLDEDAPGGSSLGPDGLTEDEDAEGFDRSEVRDAEFSRTANRAISKVALLRHSNEWIIRLRNRLARRDEALAQARAEIDSLRTLLLANGIGIGLGGGMSAGVGVGGMAGVQGLSGLAPSFVTVATGAGGGGVAFNAAPPALNANIAGQDQQGPPTMDWA